MDLFFTCAFPRVNSNVESCITCVRVVRELVRETQKSEGGHRRER